MIWRSGRLAQQASLFFLVVYPAESVGILVLQGWSRVGKLPHSGTAGIKRTISAE
jgi:hypothetical protein